MNIIDFVFVAGSSVGRAFALKIIGCGYDPGSAPAKRMSSLDWQSDLSGK